MLLVHLVLYFLSSRELLEFASFFLPASSFFSRQFSTRNECSFPAENWRGGGDVLYFFDEEEPTTESNNLLPTIVCTTKPSSQRR